MFSQKLADFEQRRQAFGPLPTQVPRAASSTDFSSTQHGDKPQSQCWKHHISEEGRARHASTLKASAGAVAQAQALNLGVARPYFKYYPWQSITFQGVSSETQFNAAEATRYLHADTSATEGEAAFDLSVAMAYGYSAGSAQLLRFVTEHVELVHEPPYADWECALTCGSTSALEMLLRMLCDRGETVLTESHTYPGALEAARPLGVSMLGIATDDGGIVASELDRVLESWSSSERGRKPHVLYTIPCGQNPTGASQDLERRRALYAVAQRHDLIIIEDDPYYFLQLDGTMPASDTTPEGYLASLPRSYLSLDGDGRVLRLDSTSKILAPGLRCGWVTGSAALVACFVRHTDVSTGSPSGISQLMAFKLIDQDWGHAGFLAWLADLARRYRAARDALVAACVEYLPRDVCRWHSPSCGMFLWISVHPHLSSSSQLPPAESQEGGERKKGREDDLEQRIHTRSKELGVHVSRGSWFRVTPADVSRHPANANAIAFRLTFAAVAPKTLREGVALFAAAVTSELLR